MHYTFYVIYTVLHKVRLSIKSRITTVDYSRPQAVPHYSRPQAVPHYTTLSTLIKLSTLYNHLLVRLPTGLITPLGSALILLYIPPLLLIRIQNLSFNNILLLGDETGEANTKYIYVFFRLWSSIKSILIKESFT